MLKFLKKPISDMHICIGAKENCYALSWSYGEICVGCGCCSDDELTRAKARLEYHKQCLEEDEAFDNWFYDDAEMLAMQKENVASNIAFEKRKIEEYEMLVKKLEDMKHNDN